MFFLLAVGQTCFIIIGGFIFVHRHKPFGDHTLSAWSFLIKNMTPAASIFLLKNFFGAAEKLGALNPMQ